MRVTMACVVPRCTVTPSRKVLCAPMSTPVGSSLYLRCCGRSPRTALGNTTLPRPMVNGPTRQAWALMMQSGPIVTGPSMTANGPTETLSPMSASSEMTAVGWIRAEGAMAMRFPMGAKVLDRPEPFFGTCTEYLYGKNGKLCQSRLLIRNRPKAEKLGSHDRMSPRFASFPFFPCLHPSKRPQPAVSCPRRGIVTPIVGRLTTSFPNSGWERGPDLVIPAKRERACPFFETEPQTHVGGVHAPKRHSGVTCCCRNVDGADRAAGAATLAEGGHQAVQRQGPDRALHLAQEDQA